MAHADECVPPDDTAPDPWAVVLDDLSAGRMVVVPTDTVYGVGVVATDPVAVASLFRLKARDRHKPIAVLVADLDQARKVGRFDAVASRLAERFWPGGLTLVVPRAPGFRTELGGDRDTVGIRCPNHDRLRSLLARSGPLAVTSANPAGERTPATAAAIAAVFGDAVSSVIDGGTLAGVASTVVDCTGATPDVLRQGPVTREHLRTAIADLA